jgi:DNA (cytosine-5)-methyltransferase 1
MRRVPSTTVLGMRDHRGSMNVRRPRALSLYAGAGGLDLGFSQAGFDILWANEWDPYACQTYAHNIGSHVVQGDVLTTKLPDGDFDVVIGGPPCQGWSRIGRMDPEDPRSQHVHHFLDVVEAVSPRAFVMENVASLGEAPRWSQVRSRLLTRVQAKLGYTPTLLVLDASHFGVAQSRRRMFLIGVRNGARISPRPHTRHRPPCVGDALRQLPAYGEMGNNTRCTARVVPAQRPVMRPSAYMGALLFNGSGRPLDLSEPARTLPASMGGNATPIVDQDELDEGSTAWVLHYHQHLKSGGQPISAAPKRMRRITVEEAAALQSFPRSFRFFGPVGAQYRQIGNAVPPALGRAVARSLIRALASSKDAGPSQVAAAA